MSLHISYLTDEELQHFPDYRGHEKVMRMVDPKIGLMGFIAAHNSIMGAFGDGRATRLVCGGLRFLDYMSEDAALTDALRLSAGMTYKSALAGLPLGGAKAVARITGHKPGRRKGFLRSIAQAINAFNSGPIKFWTGQDVGSTIEDLAELAKHTPFIAGTKTAEHPLCEPSPHTAHGVINALSGALDHAFGYATFKNVSFAISGIGKVGWDVMRILYENGADLIITDIDPKKLTKAMVLFPGIRVVGLDEIHKQDVIVYVPAALGGSLNVQTIPEMKCSIVCGPANNQLATAADDKRLFNQGIMYVPDYVANAGGIIALADISDLHVIDDAGMAARITDIGTTVRTILRQSELTSRPSGEIADELARAIIDKRRHEIAVASWTITA